jgi:hypothetical protein
MTNTVARLMSAILLIAGCDTGEGGGDENTPFQLGGKADSTCPEEEPLCWHSDDLALMAEIGDVQAEIIAGRDAKQNLRRLVEYANYIEHKLPAESLDAIADVEALIEQLPDGDLEIPPVEYTDEGPVAPDSHYKNSLQVLAKLKAEVLSPAEGAFYLANAVPLGQRLEADKADDTNPIADQDLREFGNITDDQKRSLQLLYDSGAIGASMATVLKMSGVLTKNWELINAENFGERQPDGRIRPSGLSREAKVDHIINKYITASALLGAGSGAVALIPIAGTGVSIAAETVFLLKMHLEMTFEIAAIYGWDIREGDNLYLVTSMMMVEGLSTEAADIFATNYLLPRLLKRMAVKYGFELGTDLATKLAQRSITQLLGIFSRAAQQQLAEQALGAGAKGAAKTILGWATLGAAILISAAADAAATWALGRRIESLSKQWVSDLMLEGSSYLARPEARDCAFRGMAAMAWADGTVSENEKLLFTAFLAKPYNADEQTWFNLGDEEIKRQAKMVAAWQSSDSTSSTRSCIEGRFQGSDDEHRISLLGHMYSMMQIDQTQSGAEMSLYEEYRNGLDGDGWFDGSEISAPQMDYVERAIYLTVNPGIVIRQMGNEYKQVAQGLFTKDLLEFLDKPNEAVRGKFNCAYEGSC